MPLVREKPRQQPRRKAKLGNTTNILIRGVPTTLWRDLKILAAQRDMTLKAFIVAVLQEGVQRLEQEVLSGG